MSPLFCCEQQHSEKCQHRVTHEEVTYTSTSTAVVLEDMVLMVKLSEPFFSSPQLPLASCYFGTP